MGPNQDNVDKYDRHCNTLQRVQGALNTTTDPKAKLELYVELIDSHLSLCDNKGPSLDTYLRLSEAIQILGANRNLLQTRLGGEIFRREGDYYMKRFEQDIRNLDVVQATMAQTTDEGLGSIDKVIAGTNKSQEFYGDSSFIEEAPNNLIKTKEGYKYATIIAENLLNGDKKPIREELTKTQKLREISMRGIYSTMVGWLKFCYRAGNHIISSVYESAKCFEQDQEDPNIRVSSPFEPLAQAFEFFEQSISKQIGIVDKYYKMATDLYEGIDSIAESIGLSKEETQEAKDLREKVEKMYSRIEETKKIWHSLQVSFLGSN